MKSLSSAALKLGCTSNEGVGSPHYRVLVAFARIPASGPWLRDLSKDSNETGPPDGDQTSSFERGQGWIQRR
jgi:hypothetical protein